MIKNTQDWSDAELKTLRELVDLKYPYSEIAERIGRTRKACIGKANRMGWKVRVESQCAVATSKPVKIRKPTAPVSIKETPILYNGDPIPLIDIRDGQCRWPHKSDKFLCCGAKTNHGKSFCPEHQNIAFVPYAPLDERRYKNLK